jgi:hypothetical protein
METFQFHRFISKIKWNKPGFKTFGIYDQFCISIVEKIKPGLKDQMK